MESKTTTEDCSNSNSSVKKNLFFTNTDSSYNEHSVLDLINLDLSYNSLQKESFLILKNDNLENSPFEKRVEKLYGIESKKDEETKLEKKGINEEKIQYGKKNLNPISQKNNIYSCPQYNNFYIPSIPNMNYQSVISRPIYNYIPIQVPIYTFQNPQNVYYASQGVGFINQPPVLYNMAFPQNSYGNINSVNYQNTQKSNAQTQIAKEDNKPIDKKDIIDNNQVGNKKELIIRGKPLKILENKIKDKTSKKAINHQTLDVESIKNSNNLKVLFRQKDYNETLKHNVNLMKQDINLHIFPKIRQDFDSLLQHKFANYVIYEMVPYLSKKNIEFVHDIVSHFYLILFR